MISIEKYFRKGLFKTGQMLIFEPTIGNMAMGFFAVTLMLTFMFTHLLRTYQRPQPMIQIEVRLSPASQPSPPQNVREAYQKRNLPSLTGKETEHIFDPFIIKTGEIYNIEPELIKAVIMAESSFNPKAVSKQGAGGLMQLMPLTAKAMGVKDPFNPEHNIKGGAKYLRWLLDIYKNDITLSLAAYNAGLRNVKKYQGVPPFGATRAYIRKVFEYYEFYKKGGLLLEGTS